MKCMSYNEWPVIIMENMIQISFVWQIWCWTCFSPPKYQMQKYSWPLTSVIPTMPYYKTIMLTTNMHVPIALRSTTISNDLPLPSTFRVTNNTIPSYTILCRCSQMGSTKLIMGRNSLHLLIHRRSIILC
jgi:hypothetical protein